jgi:glycosyltransferase XagB
VTLLGALVMSTRPHLGLIACLLTITALYFLTGVHKLWLLVRGESAIANSADTQRTAGDDLPVYTVMVPLFREGRILPALVERLKRLDYPQERFTVSLHSLAAPLGFFTTG